MHQSLSRDKSLREAVIRVNTDRIATEQEPVSINTASFSNARQELPTELARELFHRLALQLEEISKQELGEDGSFKGRSVKVIDGSTVLMPDTAENQKEFPQIRLTKTSRESAKRDLIDLEEMGLIRRNKAGGRSISYSLVKTWVEEDWSQHLDNVR